MNKHYLSHGAALTLSFLIAISAFFLSTNTAIAQADGAKLFKANCASCHKIDQKMTGPPLRGAVGRAPSQEWLLKWVKNSQELVKAGDDYAVKIFKEYNGTVMTPNPLSDEEIMAIFDYVEAYEAPAAPVAQEQATGGEEDDSSAFFWLIVMAIVFIILINVLSSVKRNLQNTVNQRDGLPPVPEYGYMESVAVWIGTHKKLTALIVLLLLVMGSVKGWYALKDIGVYQDYAPEQPIKFSHKIHAGENKINCVYCHHSAEKGKTAGIPSVNVCMNCHKSISSGKKTGETEIAKIYEAAGWNTETQKYDKPQKPIRWIKVHNLPDFVYFNHSQHVVVGKQECQTCHGPIEEMDLVKQFSPLTMRWCIDCHKTTNVNMAGNGYYDKIHEELKEQYKGMENFKVEHIGGLECAKCHY